MNQHINTSYSHSIFHCPLCKSIPVGLREEFLSDVRYTLKKYSKGDMLVAQGAVSEVLYIVIKGEFVTEMSDEKGDFIKVEHIKAPNPLAAGILFASDNISPVAAYAQTDSIAVIIPKDNIYFLMSKYDEFMKAYLSYISNKVAFLSERLRLASLRSIRAKIAYYVLKESRGEHSFHLKTSKEELSKLFGVSRPALVNVLTQMSVEGLIDVNKRKIAINDRVGLQRLF